MSLSDKQMREEFERDLREGKFETHNVQDLVKSIKPHGVELHEEAYNKCMGMALRQKQVGGDHYNKHSIQPWDIIDEWDLNFYEGNVLKYLLRRKGNRLEDLQKIAHYIEKMIELEKEC